jgi:hypothetical protein
MATNAEKLLHRNQWGKIFLNYSLKSLNDLKAYLTGLFIGWSSTKHLNLFKMANGS